MHGALVVQIKGNFDDGMRLVREMAEETGAAIVNSINPYRIQGQKTIAFEVLEALGRCPDYHCLPVGNAGQHHRALAGLLRVGAFFRQLPARRLCFALRARAIPHAATEHAPSGGWSATRRAGPLPS